MSELTASYNVSNKTQEQQSASSITWGPYERKGILRITPDIQKLIDLDVLKATPCISTDEDEQKIGAMQATLSKVPPVFLAPNLSAEIVDYVVLPDDLDVPVGLTGTLQLFGVTQGGDNVPVQADSWSSDDTDIATVDSNGEVTGVAEGSVSINALDEEENVIASATVTISEAVVVGYAIDPENPDVAEGGTAQLIVLELYSDNTSGAFSGIAIWSSDNEAVATVDSSGEVTGVSEGTAVITALDGTDTLASTTVTVNPV